MKPVWFEQAAEEDLILIRDFYETRESGAGDHLIRMLSLTVSRLSLQHGFHRKRHGFHYVRVDRFPIGIFYRLASERIEVVALIDLRSHPLAIRRRLASTEI